MEQELTVYGYIFIIIAWSFVSIITFFAIYKVLKKK